MISVNDVLREIDTDTECCIVWISDDKADSYVIDLAGKNLPTPIPVREIAAKISDGSMHIVRDYHQSRLLPEGMIPERDREFRDNLWEKLSDLLDPLNEPAIFRRACRGRLIEECSEKTGISKVSLYKHLKWYWTRGKTKNAFLPDRSTAGGRGIKKKSDKKLGRPPRYGPSAGKYIDDEAEMIFVAAVRKYYHTRSERTFKSTYEAMIKDSFSRAVVDANGETRLELLPESEMPTLRQFQYWYAKTYRMDEALRARKGEANFQLRHRAITGKEDHDLMGPGAKYQIDATVGDIYLVSQFNRADIIGRPILYFVIDAFSRMVTGMYVGLEGPSWTGAMMALCNAASDKVKFCAEYGIAIGEADWPCHHVPDAILGDRGEMEGKSVETLINSLGVRIENAPPYRADMKGIVEQYFHTVDTTVTAFLPGHVKPDMKQRGGHDYRLDAKLDLRQLTKIVIQCVLYHNNEHYLDSFDRDEDMIKEDVPPIPIKLWEWGVGRRSGLLRSFAEDTVKLCLMPTGTATVTAKGIRFKGIYYLSDRAIRERWLERARAKGSFQVDVSYDPRDMGRVYLRNTDDGSWEKCVLADWQEKYSGKYLDEVLYLQESEKQSKKQYAGKKLAARVNLSAQVEEVVTEAVAQARQTQVPKAKTQRTGSIRANRSEEKEKLRRGEAFRPGTEERQESQIPIEEAEEGVESPMLSLIRRKLEERLK